MNGQLPPLPAGFTLDGPGAVPAQAGAAPPPPGGDLPPLPPGFTLDGQAPASPSMGDRVRAKIAERSTGEEVGRQVGLTARAAVKGALALPAAIANIPAYLLNLAADGYEKATGKHPTLADLIDGKHRDSFRFPDQNQAVDNALTAVGLPVPETPTERVVQDVGSAVAGAGGSIAVGRQLAQGAPGVVQRVGEVLASNPALQGASAVSGGSAAGVTREMGGGPVAQTVAGVVGSIIPSVPGVIREGARTLGQAGAPPQQIENTVKEFGAIGVTPSVGQATGGRLNQATENMLGRTPGAAGRMHDFAGQQAGKIGDAVEANAARLAPSKEAAQLGLKIDDGVGNFVDAFKDRQKLLYDKLDEFIPSDSRVPLTKTMAALEKLNASIPGAPNTSKFFRNAKMSSIEGALQEDVSLPTPAQQQLTAAEAKLAVLERSRADAVQQGGRFEAFANDQTQRANSAVPVPGMPRVPGRYTVYPERAAEGVAASNEARDIARQRLQEAQTVEQSLPLLQQAADAETGTLPYEAIKKLRTLVGNELADSGITSDVPRSKWKALYAALSADLEGAAVAAGPGAKHAWTRANQFTAAGMERINFLERVVTKHGGPEAIYKAATSGTRDGATTLRTVMQSLPKGEQRMLAAGVIRRLGLAKAGQQNAMGDQFSTETFLTNWNNLSPAAKRTLFNRFGPTYRQDMDRVASIAANIRAGSKVFQNPSGTAQAAAQYTTVGAAALAVITGQFQVAGAMAGGAGLANIGARVMTSPKVVNWLAQNGEKPIGALPAVVNQLVQQSQDDPAAAELAQSLSSAPAGAAP